jgi:hypothetical protein
MARQSPRLPPVTSTLRVALRVALALLAGIRLSLTAIYLAQPIKINFPSSEPVLSLHHTVPSAFEVDLNMHQIID